MRIPVVFPPTVGVANFALDLQSDIFVKCFHRQTYFFWPTSFTVLLLLYINYKLLNTVGLRSSIRTAQ